MSTPVIPWAELLKNRRVQLSSRNSGMLMENIQRVLSVAPNAQLKQLGNLWQLFEGAQALSNPHPGHFDCWQEAAAAVEESCRPHPPIK